VRTVLLFELLRVFAIGDIHGCCASLKTLTKALELKREDLVITLGDYVDRGPDSKGVIDYLLALQSEVQLVPLKGNHEIMMLTAKAASDSALFWLRYGGDATLTSYAADTLDDIPGEHWEFLESTLPYYETETHFFVHANAEPNLPLSKQPDDVLYWLHLNKPWFRKPALHQSGKVMICGHTAQASGTILDLDTIICIDTLAHGGQWLTCLEPSTGHFLQANEEGQLRNGTLPQRQRRD
jgi:serine/threonine protein phosphatase 1